MNLQEKLNELVEDHHSPKFERIVERITEAAREGRRTMSFSESVCDESTIQKLKKEGLNVKAFEDQREGNFITISW